MLEMGAYFANEPGLWSMSIHQNFFGPLLIGAGFTGLGTYIRLYDENENSRLTNFGLICLILGSSSMALSLCWFLFEYKDRQQMSRRTRANFLSRAFFLNLNQPNQLARNNALYSAYLNSRRRSFRWYERRSVVDDIQQPPPSYHQATANQLSFINLESNQSNLQTGGLVHNTRQTNDSDLTKYLNGHKDENRSDRQMGSFIELSVLNLESLLPTYEEAINIKIDQSNGSTKL